MLNKVPENTLQSVEKNFIDVVNVYYQQEDNLLMHNVNCKISSHGKTVVMGPNGAGKSLFLRLLAGLLTPSRGKILGQFSGLDTFSFSKMLIIFQRPVMLRRTAAENISYVLYQLGVPKLQIADKVLTALKQARLENCADRQARNLSGGEQQRLALARAMAVNPPALLLDEATANLDPASTHIFEDMIHSAAQKGTKIIFVTHDIRQAKRIADDILFVHGGTILTQKPARAFFKEPGSAQAQAYLDGRLYE